MIVRILGRLYYWGICECQACGSRTFWQNTKAFMYRLAGAIRTLLGDLIKKVAAHGH